ncbi:MAG: glycosyltransferase family 2 protein [Clostridia bacterium]|nr:glycosyltransferase family 2 protein [Clostridia bacterium]
MVKSIIYALSVLVQLFIIVLGMYYVLVALFSFIKKPEGKTIIKKMHKFALIVAAHNEEKVIAGIVDSLQNLQYDKENYDVYVIADNCTDDTAKIAREHGAIACERTNTEKRGKGYALEWMFEKIFAMEDKEYDAICVFDADNLVAPQFLTEINEKFNQGFRAVQGYVDVKNPNDSWITASYAITFWCINKLFQTARSNLGLSNQINGTGFALKCDLIKENGWGATCLAEDMEFTMKLVSNDIKVGWAPNAVVYDEKPLTLSQSFKQRTRWMQGHVDVASRFLIPLLKKTVKEKNIVAFDCAVYLVQPVLLILTLLTTLISFVQLFFPQVATWCLSYLAVPTYVWNVTMIVQLVATPFVLFIENRLTKKMLTYYLPYLLFTYTWLPIAVVGFAKRKNKEWFHTQHTRKIAIDEMK